MVSLFALGGKWTIRLIVPALIIAAILFYLANGIQDTSIERFDITGISELSLNSFTINGNLYVHNPSELSVPVRQITYDVILKETNEVIGSGSISSFTLAKDSTSQIPFNQQISWVPTVELATDLLLKDSVMVEVVGELTIDLPKVEEYSLPFSQETDIKEYIRQFVPLPSVDVPVVENVTKTVTDVVIGENNTSDSLLSEVTGILG